MFDVVLFEPEIPSNTGNIIRLCANTGARLHVVQPLGFELDDRRLRRAGLDYHEFASITVHKQWADCQTHFNGRRVFAVSTKGTQPYDRPQFREGDVLLFGPETRGLPSVVLEAMDPAFRLRIPMLSNSRSLNLSNAVAVVLYEALRQHQYGLCR